MTTLDDYPELMAPPEPRPPTGAASERRHRHHWEPTNERSWSESDGPRTLWRCERCGQARDERSRRGRLSRRKGNDFEREVAARLGIRRVGQYGGPEDVAGDWIAVQCKVGKSFPERLWRWLPPGKADQLRAVVIGDAPGPGKRRRVLIALDFDDFVVWYGRNG